MLRTTTDEHNETLFMGVTMPLQIVFQKECDMQRLIIYFVCKFYYFVFNGKKMLTNFFNIMTLFTNAELTSAFKDGPLS